MIFRGGASLETPGSLRVSVRLWELACKDDIYSASPARIRAFFLYKYLNRMLVMISTITPQKHQRPTTLNKDYIRYDHSPVQYIFILPHPSQSKPNPKIPTPKTQIPIPAWVALLSH